MARFWTAQSTADSNVSANFCGRGSLNEKIIAHHVGAHGFGAPSNPPHLFREERSPTLHTSRLRLVAERCVVIAQRQAAIAQRPGGPRSPGSQPYRRCEKVTDGASPVEAVLARYGFETAGAELRRRCCTASPYVRR